MCRRPRSRPGERGTYEKRADVVGRREWEGSTGSGVLEGVGVHGNDAYILKVRAVSSLCILRPRPPGRPLAAE